MQFFFICISLLLSISLGAKEVIKENLAKAHSGDWIVVSFNKNFSFYKVLDNSGKILHLEEACISLLTFKSLSLSWKEWALKDYPGSLSRIVYEVNIPEGRVRYSMKKEGYSSILQGNPLLSTLMTLELKKIPVSEMKRVGLPLFNSGPTETRPIWQPRLVYEGKIMKNACFDAYKGRWPKDHSDLSQKMIEIYLPQEDQMYPSYFPYFMQVSGMIGKAKLHIVDSGHIEHKF